MKPTLNILATANASRGENTVKLTTTILKQIIKEELERIEEGPTPVSMAMGKRYNSEVEAMAALEAAIMANNVEGVTVDGYEVEAINVYKIVKKS